MMYARLGHCYSASALLSRSVLAGKPLATEDGTISSMYDRAAVLQRVKKCLESLDLVAGCPQPSFTIPANNCAATPTGLCSVLNVIAPRFAWSFQTAPETENLHHSYRNRRSNCIRHHLER
jgi:hypothetical protein